MKIRDIGYTTEEYIAISTTRGLPPRCPIFRRCSRAMYSRYVLGYRLGNDNISFEDFISSSGQVWPVDDIVAEIEQMSWTPSNSTFCDVENCCPEIPLYEPQYLPASFKLSAFGSATFYKESLRFEAMPKHFSECAEFSEQWQKNTATTPTKRKNFGGRKRSPISQTLRMEIFQTHDFRCYYCKRHKDDFPTGVKLTIDHKVPHSDGGDDSFSNLVPACSECNLGKSNKRLNGI